MYDGWKVVLGLIVFALFFTMPIWLNSSANPPDLLEDLTLPQKATQCAADPEYMKANHMTLLDRWRDEVVRENKRYVQIGGVKFEKSLTKTCLKCHGGRANFCDKCHERLSVEPYCWECHVDKFSPLDEKTLFENSRNREAASQDARPDAKDEKNLEENGDE